TRRADEPASSCRRYPPNAKHSAEGAIKPLFRPTRAEQDTSSDQTHLLIHQKKTDRIPMLQDN
ncbi:MAG: hypothetical protein Q8Q28_13990, partial [Pseudomonadota bacterium]|nr:hypothetical protein [Pseudomonadota bacterium]